VIKEEINDEEIFDQINLKSAKSPHISDRSKKKVKKASKKTDKNQDKFATIELNFDDANEKE
jgi:hypothetical protein